MVAGWGERHAALPFTSGEVSLYMMKRPNKKRAKESDFKNIICELTKEKDHSTKTTKASCLQ